MQKRSVSFAGRSVVVAWNDTRAEDLVEFLYGDTPDTTHVEPVAKFDIRADSPGIFSVSIDGLRFITGEPAGGAALRLLSESLYRLIAASDAGVTLHAAAVAVDGHAVLFPGRAAPAYQPDGGVLTIVIWRS